MCAMVVVNEIQKYFGTFQALKDVSLEVAVDNAKAMKFYKKHGYSVLKVLPRYYLNSIDGLLMGKKL